MVKGEGLIRRTAGIDDARPVSPRQRHGFVGQRELSVVLSPVYWNVIRLAARPGPDGSDKLAMRPIAQQA
jgi:hypothetical protein